MVEPITPADAFRGQEQQVEKAVEIINGLIEKEVRRLQNREKKFRIHRKSIQLLGGNDISYIDIDAAINRFTAVGWHIHKQDGVQVDRNDFDTVYDFMVQ